LAELGVDPSLTDVTMGTGDPDSYLYDWYLGDVKEENKIASGMTAEVTLPATGLSDKPASVRLILVVTDNNSQRDPKIAMDELVLNANSVYLPAVQAEAGQ
jgi:hypothetical protein